MKILQIAMALIVVGPALVCANPMRNSLAPAVSERQLYQFVPVVQLNTTAHMNNSQIMYIDPLRIKVTLPWWTSVIGGTISFLLALKSVTWDWFRNRPPPPWTFSSPSSIIFMIGIASTFIQNFALLCTIIRGATSHRLSMITPVTGNAYLALFETAATLWTARMLEFKIARLAGWINASLSMLNFVLLSLPFIGTAGLYQVYSPYCTLVVSPTSGFPCAYYFPHNSGNCSSLDELQIGLGTSLGQILSESWINYGNWAYAGFIAVLFLLTMRAQLYYVKRWKRLGATGGLHEQVETQDVQVGTDLVEAQIKIQSSWRFAAALTRYALPIGAGLAFFSWYSTATIAMKPTAIQAAILVWPNITNSSGSVNEALSICVQVALPGAMASVGEVLKEDSGSFGRLLFNLL